jgi:hypothetical protein
MFEDFDYKKALGGGGKLIKGVVKAVSPDAGAGVDEAGGGLGDILKAAGVELTDEEAQPEATPTPQPPPKKSNARRFDEFGLAPRTPAAPERLPNGGWREVQRFQTPDGGEVLVESPPREAAPVKREPIKREPQREPTDREITAALLKERGWSADEIAKILGGPPSEAPAQRVQEADAERVKESDADTKASTAIVNAAAPAKRVPTAPAKRIKD